MVKRNNFFKTYDIEKYDGKTFYQMGQYRVQATDLVVFKEVPIKIRASFYNDPSYIVINRDGIYNMGYYGSYFKEIGEFGRVDFLDTNNGQLLRYCVSEEIEGKWCDKYPGTDLKITETIYRKITRFELTKDAEGKSRPLKESKTEKIMEKGSIVISWSNEINGYIYVSNELEERFESDVWIPVNSLKPVGDKR